MRGEQRGGNALVRLIARVGLVAVAALSGLAVGRSTAAASCTGDCDGDGAVTINELLVGVNIALGSARVGACASFDSSGEGEVTIDEILTAVNNALNGCALTPTPTVPPTPPPTATVTTPSATVTATLSATVTVTATPTVTRTPTVVVTPVFPANYRSTYTVVRDCRFSSEHGLVYIRVLANSLAAQPYLNNANPLPVGSTVVKEEFSSPDCNLNSLVRWRAMRKEAPGFDAVDGDWHWQWVEPNRSVTFNDKSTCISCHVRPECLARDHMCTLGTAPRGTLQLILNRQAAALLSISGTSASDVYTVGADPGDGFGPYVLALQRHALAASQHRHDRRSVVDQRHPDRWCLLHGRRQWAGVAVRPEYEQVHAAGHVGYGDVFRHLGNVGG